MGTTIYYDGECPFCSNYVGLIRLRESVGDVRLVDVRVDAAAREKLQEAGYDLDRGMAIAIGDRIYAGPDAMHFVAQYSAPGGRTSNLLSNAFRSRSVATALYPLLRCGRSLTLFALGRTRINGEPENLSAYATLFSHVWGVMAFMQLMYSLHPRNSSGLLLWSTWIVGAIGGYLALSPRSPRAFALLISAMVLDAYQKAPEFSNHAILCNFSLAAIVVAGAYNWLRGRSWSSFMSTFAPVGRCLLGTMYVFGVFHKINTDFLNPDVSCAVALWSQMPAPLSSLAATWFHSLAIYGTLIGESAILAGLMFHRTRQISIIAGMLFHSLLALSGFGLYPAFSTLAISLHVLFLSPGAAARIIQSPQWLKFPGGDRMWKLAMPAWLLGIYALTNHDGNASLIGAFWLVWSLRLVYLIGKFGKEREGEFTHGPPMWSRTWAINAISVMFFFNCVAPYVGLKTAQSMNMFANLALEGGNNNHLVLSGLPRPFTYLDEVITPIGGGPGLIGYASKNGLSLTYYSLLDQLERNRSDQVSYVRGGQLHSKQSYATLKDDIDRELHPRWFRAWFHFRPIDMRSPKQCSTTQ